MRIIILTAMDKELNLVLSLLDNGSEVILDKVTAIKGSIGSHVLAVAKCGIGKVNAALRCQSLIRAFNPDLIINTGVAGGAGLPVGSVLVADKVAYDDVWCGPGTDYGQADGSPKFFLPSQSVLDLSKKIDDENKISYGLICSGDKFISSADEIKFIRSHFPEVKAVDMESAAIAQTCYINSTPFSIIRVVSDTPGEGENILQYKNFWDDAPHKTFHVLKKIIGNLGKEECE